MAAGNQGLLLLSFIGGIAAATGMVIVSTMALAIMLTNSKANIQSHSINKFKRTHRHSP